jgi:hypothetical protein
VAGVAVLLILIGVGYLAYAFKDELAEILGDGKPLNLLVGALACAAAGLLAAVSVVGFLGTPEGRRLVASLGAFVEGVLVVAGVVALGAAFIAFLIWVDGGSGPGPPRHGGGEGTGYGPGSSDGGDGGDGGGGDGGGGGGG